MTAEMVAPAWMHTQISAEQYDSWSEEQCAGIEIVDGMVAVSPSASKRHNRLARILANAPDTAAGADWNADRTSTSACRMFPSPAGAPMWSSTAPTPSISRPPAPDT
ncbi:hypothetical protein JOC24_000673 [Streptomyces sp. HB132]|nr:hypothetical protein [Streptomyces sp. HB132]